MKLLQLGFSDIRDFEDYASSPKSKIYWPAKYPIFYKIPYSLPCEDWDEWVKWATKNHPIQYFFRDSLFWKLHFFWRRLNDKWYYLKCLLFKRYNVIKLPLPPTWIDSDSKIETFLEKILFDYIEKEECFKVIDWTHNEQSKEDAKFLRESYDFLKIERPKLEKRIDHLMELLYGKGFDLNSLNKKKEFNLEHERNKDELEYLEKKLDETKTKIYLWIVNRRHTLWT